MNELDTQYSQEEEPKLRHMRIGIMGAMGAGKSTLAIALGRRWGVNTIEENFGENPFLVRFYENRKEYSFKSQTWFLEEKVKQLALLKFSGTEIIDPALEMDFIYAYTQYRLGWMSGEEFKMYETIYNTFKREKKIPFPDVFIVVDAPSGVLLQRIEKRIKEGGRDFERPILTDPLYLEALNLRLSEWVSVMTEKKFPVMMISSDGNNFAEDEQSREITLGRIEGFIAIELSKNPRTRTGERLILPAFAPVQVRDVDITPGLSAQARRAYRG